MENKSEIGFNAVVFRAHFLIIRDSCVRRLYQLVRVQMENFQLIDNLRLKIESGGTTHFLGTVSKSSDYYRNEIRELRQGRQLIEVSKEIDLLEVSLNSLTDLFNESHKNEILNSKGKLADWEVNYTLKKVDIDAVRAQIAGKMDFRGFDASINYMTAQF